MSFELVDGQACDCLVVDDSRVVRKAARRVLEGLGFAVREAEDGAKALEACRDAVPDFVLLDWNMPVMDGIAFLLAPRKEQGGKALVILCTTENDASTSPAGYGRRQGIHDEALRPRHHRGQVS